MLKIVHRVNNSDFLKTISKKYGVELDLKAYGDRLILNHEAFQDGEDFENYLKFYKHKFLVLNIKETGIEKRVLDLMKKFQIEDYFLLDVEAPYLYRASNFQGIRKMAVRYSEYEPIEMVENFKGKVDWVWIDTVTKLPLDEDIVKKLEGFKTCLVCPERWGRPEDIEVYAKQMKKLNFKLTAVMTAFKYIQTWEKYYE